MTHDQMCPNTPETFHDGVLWPAVCLCDLIGRVRKDDEDKFLWRYSAAEQRGYKAGESAGYAAALRDIHAEVQDMPPVLGPAIHGIGTVLVARDRVLSAIEVLRGER